MKLKCRIFGHDTEFQYSNPGETPEWMGGDVKDHLVDTLVTRRACQRCDYDWVMLGHKDERIVPRDSL